MDGISDGRYGETQTAPKKCLGVKGALVFHLYSLVVSTVQKELFGGSLHCPGIWGYLKL